LKTHEEFTADAEILEVKSRKKNQIVWISLRHLQAR